MRTHAGRHAIGELGRCNHNLPMQLWCVKPITYSPTLSSDYVFIFYLGVGGVEYFIFMLWYSSSYYKNLHGSLLSKKGKLRLRHGYSAVPLKRGQFPPEFSQWHPIACPWGQGTRCLLRVHIIHIMFQLLHFCMWSDVILHSTVCSWVVWCHNDTRLYAVLWLISYGMQVPIYLWPKLNGALLKSAITH